MMYVSANEKAVSLNSRRYSVDADADPNALTLQLQAVGGGPLQRNEPPYGGFTVDIIHNDVLKPGGAAVVQSGGVPRRHGASDGQGRRRAPHAHAHAGHARRVQLRLLHVPAGHAHGRARRTLRVPVWRTSSSSDWLKDLSANDKAEWCMCRPM